MTKRIIALLLALVMVFSFAACNLPAPDGNDCTESHIDEDGDEKCDRCGADVPAKDNGDEDKDAYLAPTISEAIEAQLNAATSMKVDFVLNVDVVDDGYSYDYDDKGEVVIYENDNKTKMDFAFSIVLSKTESGFNAMLNATGTNHLTTDDDDKTREASLYYINGSIYTYDEDLGAYVETMIPSFDALMSAPSVPAAMSELISALLAELEISEDDMAAAMAEVGKLITEIFDIENFKGELNVDYKPYFDELFKYVEEINLETKTLKSLIDDVLDLVDEELSVDGILAEVKRIAGLTVGEAMTELDAWLTENYETTIQGIYDTIVADERVEQLVRMYLESMSEEGAPVTDEDVKAFLDELKAVKVDEFIAASIDTEAVLYDVIMSLVSSMGGEEAPEPEFNPNSPEGTMPLSDELGGEDEPSYPPINTLFGAIEDYLALTLSEVEADMGPIFTSIKELCAGITVNAYSTGVSIGFTDSYALEELGFNAKLDVATELPFEMDPTKTEKVAVKVDYSFTISSISSSAVEITLPEESKVIFGFFNIEEMFSDEDGMYELELYWPYEDENGKFLVEGELYVPDMYIDISMEMPTEKQDVYTFNYTFMPNDSNTPITGKLFITFDYEALSYSVEFERK